MNLASLDVKEGEESKVHLFLFASACGHPPKQRRCTLIIRAKEGKGEQFLVLVYFDTYDSISSLKSKRSIKTNPSLR